MFNCLCRKVALTFQRFLSKRKIVFFDLFQNFFLSIDEVLRSTPSIYLHFMTRFCHKFFDMQKTKKSDICHTSKDVFGARRRRRQSKKYFFEIIFCTSDCLSRM